MPKVRNVTVIAPTTGRAIANHELSQPVRKKVAAYARVSTDCEEQLSSYQAQVDYYTRHIQANSEWTFLGVYTDEGISATNTKKRDGFKRMITDALSGKIDLILTKSVSRFARNTVDTLTTVRKLKEKGGGGLFREREHLHARQQGGAAHHHYVITGAGREPLDLGECDMEAAQAIC